jgi:hypothetical protein
MNWRTCALSALIVSSVLAARPALAADQLAPPYGDVWGREIPGTVRYLAVSDKDLLVAHSVTPPGQSDDKADHWVEGFFSGERRAVTGAEFQALYGSAAHSPHALGTFSGRGRIVLGDGSVIAVEEMLDHRDDRWTCDVPAPAIVKRDAKGHLIWRKVVVRLLEEPLPAKADENCGDAGQPFTEKVQFWSLTYNELYGLEDGTFIAWFNGVTDNGDSVDAGQAQGANRRFVIRFDSELGSPFLKTLPDVVVVDAKAIEPVISEAAKHHHATPAAGRSYFHDRVYTALSKLKPATSP